MNPTALSTMNPPGTAKGLLAALFGVRNGRSRISAKNSTMLASRILSIMTAVILSATAAVAQTYSIPWHTINGGGGSSTGGTFSLSGTIGQWDAGQQPLIDGTYTRNLGTDGVTREMVAAMVKLARTLDFQVVAEQVEDQTAFEALRELGVDFVQGYAVEKPRPLQAVH
jgi:predicted signal transduction protein with EAL and GGDEF domain